MAQTKARNITPPPGRKRFTMTPRVGLADKIFFVQQLGIMVKTGISLAVGLRTLADQTTSKGFKGVLTDVQQSVERGNLLSASLDRYHKIFGDLFINMVKAGEASGKLEEVLRQLFMQMKKDHEIIAKVRGAMIYPLIVITMMVVIGIVVMIYVIPNITGIFKELNIDLPLPTKILIAISDGLLNYWYLFILITAGVVAAITATLRSAGGKRAWHKLKLHIPVIGGIVKKINIARFARTMSSLLKTDIPIVQSFEITAKILSNVLYKEALIGAKEKIKKGIAIRESLSEYVHLFPPVLLQMISVGEETGSIDTILEETAVFYEDDVSRTMNELPAILEPILVVILGVGVGAMAVAIIMPLYSIGQAI
jgi:type IV pilus assembly protein PilC